MKTSILVGCAFLAATTVGLADHRYDRGHREQPRVIVYQHESYGGDALVLYPGESIDNMSGKTFANGSKLNDSITSIWIEGDLEVFVYENGRYRGQGMRLTESARDLTGRFVSGGVGVTWNDRISSIKVERVRGRDRNSDRDRGPGRDRPRDNATGNPDKVIKQTFNDFLGRDPHAGEMRDFRSRMLDQGWNERMLRDYLRREDAYRDEAADLIVRRAYRDVLGRDADAGGLKQYRWAVLEKNWTESDIRDDLRKSAEFRNKPRK